MSLSVTNTLFHHHHQSLSLALNTITCTNGASVVLKEQVECTGESITPGMYCM